MENKRTIIKHSSAIQTSGEASLLERKAWNVLLMNAFDDLKDQEVYKISIGDLNKALRFNSNDYGKLRDTLKTLNRTQVEWNILDKDKEVEWEVTTLLAGVKIINEVCYYSYNPLIRERLGDPKIYAKLSLFEQSLIKGKYALILWELFKDYLQIGQTGWIRIEDFRKLLGLRKDEYSAFKALNRDVIKKVITELNKKSVIYIDPKEGVLRKKEGRKIVALKFIIQHNDENVGKIKKLEAKWDINERQLTLPLNHGSLPVEENEEVNKEVRNIELLNSLINEFQLTEEKAIQILKEKDEYQIYENLEYVRDWKAKGKVKTSLSGLTIKAIDGNYQLKDKKKVDKSALKKNQRKQILEEIRTHVLKQRQIQFVEKEALLSDQEKEQFKAEFEEEFKDELLKKKPKKNIYDGHFLFYIRSKLLPPEVDDLRAYAKSKGFDYEELLNGFSK